MVCTSLYFTATKIVFSSSTAYFALAFASASAFAFASVCEYQIFVTELDFKNYKSHCKKNEITSGCICLITNSTKISQNIINMPLDSMIADFHCICGYCLFTVNISAFCAFITYLVIIKSGNKKLIYSTVKALYK